MLFRFLTIACSALATLAAAADSQASISTYTLPSGFTKSAAYSLTANGESVDVWTNEDYHVAHFIAGNGSIDVEVDMIYKTNTALDGLFLSPQRKGVKPSVSGTKITFTMPHDDYLILSDPNGKVGGHAPLLILADPPLNTTPSLAAKGVIDVTSKNYGAKPGATLKQNTAAVQKAIDDATKNFASLQQDKSFQYAHAIVYVPKGVYMMGNLKLKSNVGLFMEPGAVFRFSAQLEDYEIQWFQNGERNVTWWIQTEFKSENVRIFGHGIIDGNYASLTNDMVQNSLVPIQTKNFRADGLILVNSGSWNTIPTGVEHGYFENMKWLNRLNGHSGMNDGIDVQHSSDVTVRHTIAIGLDDNYSTKTWGKPADPNAKWPKWPSTQHWPEEIFAQGNENIVFDDCLAWTYCYGYKIGQGVFTEQKNILFKDSTVFRASIGFGMDHLHTANDPETSIATLNVTFQGMDVEVVSGSNVDNKGWVVLRVENAHGQNGNGSAHDFTITDTVVRYSQHPGQLWGLSEANPIHGVTFKNIQMPGQTASATKLSDLGLSVINTTSVQYSS